MKVDCIVVGIDGSDCGQKALEAAADLVSDDGTVHVVTAYDEPSIRAINMAYSSVPVEFRSTIDLLAKPRNALMVAEAFLVKRGIDHKGHFEDDHPAAAILDVADGVNADLVIVGSRGLGRGSRFIRGSVSTKVANHAKTSFMVVQD